MSHEEVHEMHEQAEHGAHDPSLLPVTFTMAVLAVVLAATSLPGHRTHTEELLLQNKATDQWAYYQVKNIRRHTYELFLDLLSVSAVKDTEQANKAKEKYTKEVERYRDEQNEIESEARNLENEVHLERRRANLSLRPRRSLPGSRDCDRVTHPAHQATIVLAVGSLDGSDRTGSDADGIPGSLRFPPASSPAEDGGRTNRPALHLRPPPHASLAPRRFASTPARFSPSNLKVTPSQKPISPPISSRW